MTRWRPTEFVARRSGCVVVLHAGDGNEYGKLVEGIYRKGWSWMVTYMENDLQIEREGFALTKAGAMGAACRMADEMQRTFR